MVHSGMSKSYSIHLMICMCVDQSFFLGILIGYPLAWNVLDWLTPPIFISSCVLILMHFEGLYAWNLASYSMICELSDFVSADQMRKYRVMQGLMILLSILGLLVIWAYGLSEIIPRVIIVFVGWNAIQARRCEWLTDQRNSQLGAANLLLLSALLTASQAIIDMATIVTDLAAWTELSLLVGSLSV